MLSPFARLNVMSPASLTVTSVAWAGSFAFAIWVVPSYAFAVIANDVPSSAPLTVLLTVTSISSRVFVTVISSFADASAISPAVFALFTGE